jgi:Rrf2 family protein
MTLLSRKIDYALLILCYLHHRPEGGCARVVAEHFGLSRPFVANILKDLCQQGFVRSQRGVKGGYTLCEHTAGRSLADVLDALDETVRLAECNDPEPGSCCTLAPQCPIRAPIAEVHDRIRAVLGTVRLAEIFRQPRSAPEPVQLSLARCGQPT